MDAVKHDFVPFVDKNNMIYNIPTDDVSLVNMFVNKQFTQLNKETIDGMCDISLSYILYNLLTSINDLQISDISRDRFKQLLQINPRLIFRVGWYDCGLLAVAFKYDPELILSFIEDQSRVTISALQIANINFMDSPYLPFTKDCDDNTEHGESSLTVQLIYQLSNLSDYNLKRLHFLESLHELIFCDSTTEHQFTYPKVINEHLVFLRARWELIDIDYELINNHSKQNSKKQCQNPFLQVFPSLFEL